MIGRIGGLPDVVLSLAFSKDGRFLAIGLYGQNGIRVHDRDAGWGEARRDADYGGNVYGMAFDGAGRLAVTSYDGDVRLYRAGVFAEPQPMTIGGRPARIAFSPDGERLAVGFVNAPQVALLDVTLEGLTILPAPEMAGIGNGDLVSVAFSRDGRFLFAGGTYAEGDLSPVLRWPADGRGVPERVRAGENIVTELRSLGDGSVLVTAGDPWFGRISGERCPALDAGPSSAACVAEGGPGSRPGQRNSMVWEKGRPFADFRDQNKTLSVSADGGTVRFGYEVWGKDAATFSVSRLALRAGAGEGLSVPVQDGLEIDGWEYTRNPRLNGKPLALDPYETARSLAIHPDGERFVLGAEWSLRAYDEAGAALWERTVPEVVWAVNISGDGRFVVAAYQDGTIRWHRMGDGSEVLAVAFFADRKSWVAWTPDGYYAHDGPLSADALRWHVNHGYDATAEQVPVSRIKGFAAPGAIMALLDSGNIATALGSVKLKRDRAAVREALNVPVAPGRQLHVLSIGVSAYEADHLTLDYADDDARDLAELLGRQAGGCTVPSRRPCCWTRTPRGGISSMR